MYEPKLDINSAIQGYIGADPVISKAIEGYTQPAGQHADEEEQD